MFSSSCSRPRAAIVFGREGDLMGAAAECRGRELQRFAEKAVDVGAPGLRHDAAIGIEEIVAMRREVRLAPVRLTTSEEVRLQRLSRRAVIRDGAIFVPLPDEAPAAGLAEFVRSMWPPDRDRSS